MTTDVRVDAEHSGRVRLTWPNEPVSILPGGDRYGFCRRSVSIVHIGRRRATTITAALLAPQAIEDQHK
jgi:hypothetical protein